jgi:NAD+ synthase (glutamine-hydrolysing)
MRIALAQLNYHIGNFESNTQKVIGAIQRAKKEDAELIVFAELAICGYPPRDFLDYDEFIQFSIDSLNKIAAYTEDIGVIIGAPTNSEKASGKRLHNSAVFIYEGKVQSIHSKGLLPTYDVFDEYRFFEPENEFNILEFKGTKIALTVCEDIWNMDDQPMYDSSPMDVLIKAQPDLMINISASPFDVDHHENRIKILKENVSKYDLPIVYVNHIGAQTELIFDGGSMVMNKKGEITTQLAFFEEDLQIWDSEVKSQVIKDRAANSIERIRQALVIGIRDYFGKLGFKKAILGLSGGIDSALTAVLAVQALGKENVVGILMPSEYSSDHSVGDAEKLAQNLGIEYHQIPIKSTFASFRSDLGPVFKDSTFGLTEENLQARIRGTLLMAISNKEGYIVLNTSNKSEAAVGYGTLYGDMNGGLSVLGDLYKTKVFALSKHINSSVEIIPLNTITKEPSAELRPDQKDSDSLPDYELLDQILYQYIEEKQGRDDIISMGFDPNIVAKVLKLVNINEYKRYQTAPVLRVSKKGFGMGRRMPIVARYLI